MDLNELKNSAEKELEAIKNSKELRDFYDKYLGKKAKSGSFFLLVKI
jgi:hypothetical protein